MIDDRIPEGGLLDHLHPTNPILREGHSLEDVPLGPNPPTILNLIEDRRQPDGLLILSRLLDQSTAEDHSSREERLALACLLDQTSTDGQSLVEGLLLHGTQWSTTSTMMDLHLHEIILEDHMTLIEPNIPKTIIRGLDLTTLKKTTREEISGSLPSPLSPLDHRRHLQTPNLPRPHIHEV